MTKPDRKSYRAVVACGLAAANLLAVQTGARAAGSELNLLVWEGYADKSFVEKFEAKSGCKVSATYVGSNDDFLPKLQAGGGSVYDLMSVSTDAAPILIQAELVQPIETPRVAGYADIYEAFRTVEGLTVDGSVYGVPFEWGVNPLIYRTDKFKTPPTSIGDLWSPENKGKIGMWDDKSSLYNTARLLGIADPFHMTKEQLEQVKAKLIEQKPLLKKYWSTAGELANLMASGEVDISYTWGGIVSGQLKALKVPVAEVVPKEGADGWTDNWMLVKGTPNEDCAYQYMSFMNSAGGQCGVSTVTGYFPVNPASARICMGAEEQAAKHVGDIDYLKVLKMWQMPGDIEAYANAWNEVKSAP